MIFVRYAFVNLLLVLGAIKEIKLLVIVWIFSTLGFLIWSFALVSIMFAYDTTPGFVAGVAIAQLFNFTICIGFILVVFSFYQELVAKTIKEVVSTTTAAGPDPDIHHVTPPPPHSQDSVTAVI